MDCSSHTGVALISVEVSTGLNRIIVAQGVNKLVNKEFVLDNARCIQRAKVVVVGTEVDPTGYLEALKVARTSGG